MSYRQHTSVYFFVSVFLYSFFFFLSIIPHLFFSFRFLCYPLSLSLSFIFLISHSTFPKSLLSFTSLSLGLSSSLFRTVYFFCFFNFSFFNLVCIFLSVRAGESGCGKNGEGGSSTQSGMHMTFCISFQSSHCSNNFQRQSL